MRATRTETRRINIHGCSRERDGLSVCCFIEALVPWPLHYYIIKLQIPLQWNVYSVAALPAPHIFPWPVRVSMRMRGDDYLPSAGPCMCMNTEITLEIADESLRSNLNEYLEVYMERKRQLSFCHGMPYAAAQPLWWMCTHLYKLAVWNHLHSICLWVIKVLDD